MSKRFLRRRETFNTGDKDVISSCTDFIWESLKTAGITKVLALKSVLISEEILVEFLRKAPASVNNAFDVYLLTPVKTVFMNALKIIIAPVVFFSIVSCLFSICF